MNKDIVYYCQSLVSYHGEINSGTNDKNTFRSDIQELDMIHLNLG